MINNDINKRMIITIPKEDYAELEKLAKNNTRSVSKQALHYIRQGIKAEKTKKI